MLKLLATCLLLPFMSHSQDLYSNLSVTYFWNGKKPEIIDMSKSFTHFKFQKDYIYIDGETKLLCYILDKYQNTNSLNIDAYDCLDDDERRFFISKSFGKNSIITIVHGSTITQYYLIIGLKSLDAQSLFKFISFITS